MQTVDFPSLGDHIPSLVDPHSDMLMNNDDMFEEVFALPVQEFSSLTDPHSDMPLNIDDTSNEASILYIV
ncbi:hypothetical protein DEO72_LG3g1845 [Vigna unguiculata]|uniref:Uncharacterized protein n=1 Tax=Vigna unguiculata TaxID=3917 RepID=A0A4D6LFC5_VIGUN|nr:hypothetical protein DEO72_LG3g1845 [Vigna unguiculata]